MGRSICRRWQSRKNSSGGATLRGPPQPVKPGKAQARLRRSVFPSLLHPSITGFPDGIGPVTSVAVPARDQAPISLRQVGILAYARPSSRQESGRYRPGAPRLPVRQESGRHKPAASRLPLRQSGSYLSFRLSFRAHTTAITTLTAVTTKARKVDQGRPERIMVTSISEGLA